MQKDIGGFTFTKEETHFAFYQSRVGKYLASDPLQSPPVSPPVPPSGPPGDNKGGKSSPCVCDIGCEGESHHQTFAEFAQSTTLHGIRYAFDGAKTFNCRRLAWLMCLLVATGIFCYQASDRIWEYFHYKSTADVEMVYTKSLDFPAVTICNHNSFRLTKAVENGIYDYLDGVFSAGNMNIDSSHATSNGNVKDLLRSLAHQKEDLIYQCLWKGQACNYDDITQILTRHGVCYTIHPHEEDRSHPFVTDCGSDSGLRLTINIEQYEYMAGPHDEAGVKIMLHASEEEPMVDQQGFDVAPGTHTLVAIAKEMRHRLPKPYGSCDESNRPRSVCLTGCYLAEVIQKCSCLGFYYKKDLLAENVTDVPLCKISEEFICIKKEINSIKHETRTCHCPKPCDSVAYLHSISYALLSEHSINKFWDSQPEKQDRTKSTFYKAIGQRDRIYGGHKEQRKHSSLYLSIKSLNKYLDDMKNLTKMGVLRLEFYIERLENSSSAVKSLLSIASKKNALTTEFIEQWSQELKSYEHNIWRLGSCLEDIRIFSKESLNATDVLRLEEGSIYDTQKMVNKINDIGIITYFNVLFSHLNNTATLIQNSSFIIRSRIAMNNSFPDHTISKLENLILQYPVFIVSTHLKKTTESENNGTIPEISLLCNYIIHFLDTFSTELTKSYASAGASYQLFVNALDNLEVEANQFYDQNKIDGSFIRDNFARIDIFYADLTYKRISQQVALSFNSLMGEIGGFLGLLLGASILTVCELIDYMLGLCCRCKRK